MPTAALIVGGIAGLASAGTGIAGAVSGGKAAREQADQAKALAATESAEARRVMGFQLGEFGRQAGRFQGAQRASIAAAGVEEDVGSAGLARQESVSNLFKDRQNLREQSLARIKGIQQGGSMAAANAQAQGTQAILGGLGTAIQGIGTAGKFFGQL